MRKIARRLRTGRYTIAKYLDAPAPKPVHRERARKIDPWKAAITDLLLQNPDANAPVIAQRLRPLGYDGGFTIIKDYLIKDYLRVLRKNSVTRRAYVRVEPARVNSSMWTGVTSAHSSTRALHVRSTLSALSMLTAAGCIWSSHIRMLPHPRFSVPDGHEPRNLVRQPGDSGCRTQGQSGPLQSALPCVRTRMRLYPAGLSRSRGAENRES
jgi:hypothetical protein